MIYRILFILLLVASHFNSRHATGQSLKGRAVLGDPFGVAIVEIPIENPVSGRSEPPLLIKPIEDEPFGPRPLFSAPNDLVMEVAPPSQRQLPEAGGGRLLERVGELFKELSGDESTRYQTVSRRVLFLFYGDERLRANVYDQKKDWGSIELVPSKDKQLHQELMALWWEGYVEGIRAQIEVADYPTTVESYLLATLARQNQMPLPPWFLEPQKVEDQLIDNLKLIGGAEEASETLFRIAVAGAQDHSNVAGIDLPDPPIWDPLKLPKEVAGDHPVEPIASRVPPECFYIRYGAFSNYLWFKDLSEANGGDISKLVTLRGVERNVSGKVEKQLAFRMTQLSRVLGGTLVQDQALIGRDLYLNDGASLGVLFQSANPGLLKASFQAERRKIAEKEEEVALQEVEVSGRVVSYLGSPDHRVRSFLVVDGNYLLVTNSQHLMERFFEVGSTGESLASTASFRMARRYMPLSREDTVFAYFSPRMFQELVSPRYMIELRRRLFAKADLVMVQLARLLTTLDHRSRLSDQEPLEPINEKRDLVSIEELVQRRLLPPSFGNRFDGSGVFEVGDRVIDSLRGSRGTFLPISDVDLISVTEDEASWYQGIADSYSERFANFDPIMVGVQRKKLDNGLAKEQIAIHAEVAPWDPGKYGEIAEQLGPPTRTVMRFAPDDIVSVQAHVASDWIGPPTHLFAAIKDTVPPDPSRFSGVLTTYFSLRQIPGYLGAWPQPGALDRLPLGLGRGRQIGPGMTKIVGGLYRYNDGQFSVLSFQPEILNRSLPHLAAIESGSTAQLRIRIGDLGGSQLQSWVNQQLYQRASQSSSAGAKYLELISRNLPVASENALSFVEEILDAKVQCTLGGDYEQISDDPPIWRSTAWNAQQPPEESPDNYQAPILRWFHGVEARLTQLDERIIVDLNLDLQ